MALKLDKINEIMKKVLIFLIIFLVVNYVLQFFFKPKQEEVLTSAGNILFETGKKEYGRNKTIILNIFNNTGENISFADDCPNEPFDVYFYKNNEWQQKTVSPKIECDNNDRISLKPGEEYKISYDKWNHALFNEIGRYKIEAETTLGGKSKIITSNEFTIQKEGIFSQLWNGLFYRPIYNGLIFLTYAIPGHDLGLAIIILTIIIRTILLVPSQKAMSSQKKMQEIQPRLEKIKEKYKGDQQKIAMETMAVWKEAKVKPLGSCLPLLMQFPFLIAIFYVIQNGLNPDNTYLLYTNYQNFSLANIDTHFLGLNLTKTNLYILPLIIGGLQFFQMKLTMGRKQKKTGKVQNELAMANNIMIYMMPVLIAVFTATLPSGVGIYWGASTIYGIVQQYFVNKSSKTSEEEPKVRVIETSNK